MRPAVLAGLALGIGGLGPACCPIPIPRQVSVRPQLRVEVRDAHGDPAADVPLTVRRTIVGPPPDRETHRWTGATGPKGVVVFEALEAREPHLPLMMHGVNWYGWEVCAEDPVRGSALAAYAAKQPVEAPVALELTLDPSRPACGWETLETLHPDG